MAETSKSFWGKFKKTKLSATPFHDSLPTALREMFPSLDSAELYNTYHVKCNASITKTVEYLTGNQPANYLDEVPIHTLIESLKDCYTPHRQQHRNRHLPDYFALTPTHILSHIFSFNGPMTWGKITRLNRECRLLSKSLLSKIKSYDFSYFYHNYCQFKLSTKAKKRKIQIRDDELKLISHINAFQFIESLSLRSTHFTKWHTFQSVLNKNHIKYLNLSASLNLYDDDLCCILPHFPALNTLDLSKCIEITDLGMTHIIECENTNNLRTIYLNHTPQITKYGVKQLIQYRKSVVNLEWKGAKHGNVTLCFEAAKHVQYLNLSSNQYLEQMVLTLHHKNGSLDLNLSNCPKLRFLDLNITHLQSIHLTQCLKLREVRISHASQLKEINCRSCIVLTLLAVPCHTVKTVQLSGCNSLNLELLLSENNFLMQSLISGALQSLDISQINHISNDDMDQILDINRHHNNPLKALSVSHCKRITNTKIDAIHSAFAKPTTNSQRVQKRMKRIEDRKRRKYNC